MRMAYLILAHEDEAQLDALLDVLVPPGSTDVAIVHADRRSTLWSSLSKRKDTDDGRILILRDPVAVRWGHCSQIIAISKLVQAAVAAGCDYAHLISGADWPVLRPQEMASRIAADGSQSCYVDIRPGHMEDRMQTFRFDTRWLRLDPNVDKKAYAVTWELRRIARWLDAGCRRLKLQRSRPWGQWCYGSQWWSLPADALALLSKELPKLIASGRLAGTVCADEHVIPTIINRAFAGRIKGNRRFVAFLPESSSPRLLDDGDVGEICASDAWFMRKVGARQSMFFQQFPIVQDCASAIGENAPMC